MKTKIIEDFILAISDDNVSVTNLLRKALNVAEITQDDDMLNLLEKERDGYNILTHFYMDLSERNNCKYRYIIGNLFGQKYDKSSLQLFLYNAPTLENYFNNERNLKLENEICFIHESISTIEAGVKDISFQGQDRTFFRNEALHFLVINIRGLLLWYLRQLIFN